MAGPLSICTKKEQMSSVVQCLWVEGTKRVEIHWHKMQRRGLPQYVPLLHDNVCPHSAVQTKETL
jgi:hypothetical protein